MTPAYGASVYPPVSNLAYAYPSGQYIVPSLASGSSYNAAYSPNHQYSQPSGYRFPQASQQAVEGHIQGFQPDYSSQKAQQKPASSHLNHDHSDHKPSNPLKAAALAVGLFAGARLLHRLPARHHVDLPKHLTKWKALFQVFPTDWKTWAQMFMGVGVVNQINKALDAEPKSWLKALETVAVLTPMMGVKMLGKETWRHAPLLAVTVPLLVQGSTKLTEKLANSLKESNSAIPTWTAKVGIPVLTILAGAFGIRGVMGSTPYRQLTGQSGGSNATGQMAGSEIAAICPRCGGVHLACPMEISEFFGSVLSGLGIKQQPSTSSIERKGHDFLRIPKSEPFSTARFQQ
ncbi:MAG: hypothetical protein KTR14_11515 [Vampirovibrio sp.]|nr:hypothetical protein [Vampirovibrio sp.]